MGLSCQKTQVTGWGPFFCRKQIAVGIWKDAGCKCTVTALEAEARGLTPGVSGPVSQAPLCWALCQAIYRPWGLEAETSSSAVLPSVLCNLWPQVPSLSCLQRDGREIPSPQFPHLRPPGSVPGPPSFRTHSSAGQGEDPIWESAIM